MPKDPTLSAELPGRGPGRPRSPLTATLPRIRVHPDELARWRRVADLDGRTLSGWIRHSLNESASEGES